MKERPQSTRLSLTVIVAAAVLLGLTMGVMFYTSHKMLQQTVEQLVSREMNAIYLCIRNKLAKVEVTMDNMSWVTYENLDYPDDMFTTTRRLVKNNPDFLSSAMASWYISLSMISGVAVRVLSS